LEDKFLSGFREGERSSHFRPGFLLGLGDCYSMATQLLLSVMTGGFSSFWVNIIDVQSRKVCIFGA
jgi:hypothetical protein